MLGGWHYSSRSVADDDGRPPNTSSPPDDEEDGETSRGDSSHKDQISYI